MALQQSLPPFHLAFPVHDLDEARRFYGGMLGCPEGRSSDKWIDFNFFGHQIVTHLVPTAKRSSATNPVDGHGVPVPHFGVVLTIEAWTAAAKRFKREGVSFVIAPYIRFKGEVGEQATMFFLDPSGNAIEMKAFANPDNLFAK